MSRKQSRFRCSATHTSTYIQGALSEEILPIEVEGRARVKAKEIELPILKWETGQRQVDALVENRLEDVR